MSIFTNSASRSKDEAQAYTAAILDLLGDQDPASVLRDTPAAVRQAIAGLTDAQLSTPEAAGNNLHRTLHLARQALAGVLDPAACQAPDRFRQGSAGNCRRPCAGAVRQQI